jgi:hypothetical protein
VGGEAEAMTQQPVRADNKRQCKRIDGGAGRQEVVAC